MRGGRGRGAGSAWAGVAVRLLAALVVTSLAATVLAAVGVASYAGAWGVTAVVVGALVGLTATDLVSRTGAVDTGTVWGAGLRPGPDRSRDREGGLTGFGAFLLVGLPLALAGMVVLSV